MDLADQSNNAIIRPGLMPRWRVVCKAESRSFEMIRCARSPHTFGATTEFTLHDSKNCCGAIFLAGPERGICARDYWLLQYFFERDGNEARVFEFDKWTKHFTARRLEELTQRRIYGC